MRRSAETLTFHHQPYVKAVECQWQMKMLNDDSSWINLELWILIQSVVDLSAMHTLIVGSNFPIPNIARNTTGRISRTVGRRNKMDVTWLINVNTTDQISKSRTFLRCCNWLLFITQRSTIYTPYRNNEQHHKKWCDDCVQDNEEPRRLWLRTSSLE